MKVGLDESFIAHDCIAYEYRNSDNQCFLNLGVFMSVSHRSIELLIKPQSTLPTPTEAVFIF